ncbi:MAG: 3-isopropylmalate dehydratase small subunit [Puniceicoccaceae bacterium]|nr:MAG: 3-isopropylmalate dehydratase small subunit [Puniceicoccaceae bacterium]
MALEKIKLVQGRAVPVPGDAIDTDRIIPARFMKCVTFDGLGEYLFYDVRKNDDGTDKPHPLNDPRYAGASILISGANFGCGSSREHAPQALYRHGFRAVVAESFAEIFFGNCTTLGIPCLSLKRADLRALTAAVEEDPSLPVTVDVEAAAVRLGDREFAGEIRPSARQALLEGRWDPIGELLEGLPAANASLSRLGYV